MPGGNPFQHGGFAAAILAGKEGDSTGEAELLEVTHQRQRPGEPSRIDAGVRALAQR